MRSLQTWIAASFQKKKKKKHLVNSINEVTASNLPTGIRLARNRSQLNRSLFFLVVNKLIIYGVSRFIQAPKVFAQPRQLACRVRLHIGKVSGLVVSIWLYLAAQLFLYPSKFPILSLSKCSFTLQAACVYFLVEMIA